MTVMYVNMVSVGDVGIVSFCGIETEVKKLGYVNGGGARGGYIQKNTIFEVIIRFYKLTIHLKAFKNFRTLRKVN